MDNLNEGYSSLAEKILLEKLTTKTLMLEEELKEVSQYLDEDNIKEVFKKAYSHIGDILHEEHGYSEAEIERKLEDVFNDTKKYTSGIIQKSRSKEILDKLFSVHQVSDSKIYSESQSGEKEIDDLSKLKNEVLAASSQVIENAPDNQSSTVSLLEDAISTEMKYQIKRALKIYEDPRGEEAFYEVSRYIDSRLSQDVVEGYLIGTKNLNKNIEDLYTEVLDEIITEYSQEKEKQQESKVEESTKNNFEQSLQNATKSSEEIVKIDTETLTSEENKSKVKDDKLITHVID